MPKCILTQKFRFTYTTDNLLDTVMYLDSTGSGWSPSYTDVYSYSGTQILSRHSYWGTSVISGEEVHRQLNSENLPEVDLYLHRNANGWDTAITTIAYNSFNDPIATMYTSFYQNGLTMLNRYHYETYEVSSVAETGLAKDLLVFPNPATNELYIDARQFKRQTRRVRILNDLGQLVYQLSIADKTEKISIPIAHLKPGVYWVNLDDGKELYQASFMKN